MKPIFGRKVGLIFFAFPSPEKWMGIKIYLIYMVDLERGQIRKEV